MATRQEQTSKKVKKKQQPTAIQDVEKFIGGMVARLIRSYEMIDFVVEGQGSDYRQDMMQTARLAVLAAQKNHPTKAQNPQYLKTVINNSLFKFEQAGRTRRMNTLSILDEPISNSEDVEIGHHRSTLLQNSIPQMEPYAAMEAKQDVEQLITKANLTDAEALCIEMQYGFARGQTYGECGIARTAQLVGRSENWVRSRLTAAMVKLSVTAE